jgi:(E)-4-hydroxy-3-methylbut-2-enyl-diphosphate synthase
MIEAYRLVVSMMSDEKMDYPLHLGVTEAGDGEDARIKSAIGIGSLLLDGLGDTLRVSLTEDPVAEIPVAQDLAKRAEYWWKSKSDPIKTVTESLITPSGLSFGVRKDPGMRHQDGYQAIQKPP